MIVNKKIEKENRENPEIEKPIEAGGTLETEVTLDNKENLTEDFKSLREKIEKSDIDDSLKLKVKSQADDINLLEDNAKVEELLKIADLKGVIYAVKVAQNMGDPYILDALHDAFIERGYYEKLA